MPRPPPPTSITSSTLPSTPLEWFTKCLNLTQTRTSISAFSTLIREEDGSSDSSDSESDSDYQADQQAKEEKVQKASGSRATLATALFYRAISKQAGVSLSNWPTLNVFKNHTLQMEVEALLKGSSGEDDSNDKNSSAATNNTNTTNTNKPNFELLLKIVKKSGAKFPTLEDEIQIRNTLSLACFGSFVHILRQIETPYTDPVPICPSRQAHPKRRLHIEVKELAYSTQLLTPFHHSINQFSPKAPHKGQKARDQHELQDSPLARMGRLQRSSTASDRESDDSEDEDTYTFTDPIFGLGNTLGALRMTEEQPDTVPKLKLAAEGEAVVVFAGISLLIEVWQAFPVAGFSFNVSPANFAFQFCYPSYQEEGKKSGKRTKLWEARVDGALIRTAADKSIHFDALIEAKNKERSDKVRYQEIAEMVAMIRGRVDSKEERLCWVIGMSGDSYTITVAEWGVEYERELEKLASIQPATKREEKFQSQMEFDNFLAKERFLTMTENRKMTLREHRVGTTWLFYRKEVCHLNGSPKPSPSLLPIDCRGDLKQSFSAEIHVFMSNSEKFSEDKLAEERKTCWSERLEFEFDKDSAFIAFRLQGSKFTREDLELGR